MQVFQSIDFWTETCCFHKKFIWRFAKLRLLLLPSFLFSHEHLQFKMTTEADLPSKFIFLKEYVLSFSQQYTKEGFSFLSLDA